MRRIVSILTALGLVITLTACGEAKETGEAGGATNNTRIEKVGMVTNWGNIDDKSFNQNAWEGINAYADEKNAVKKGTTEVKYIKPPSPDKAEYINAISTLVDAEYEVIVTPGFGFSNAIYEAQTQFKDTRFVLIDTQPSNEDGESRIDKNVISIFFAEEQGGFLAGIASALGTESNKLGFIGGIPIPPVQKYGYGFVAGVAYANKTLGTNASVVDYVYQGTFTDVEAGTALAGGMYDKGIDVIFPAAGSVTLGVFTEAKKRKTVSVVGIDSDQWDEGVYDTDENKSVTLVSVLKRVDTAAYVYTKAHFAGEFEGGKAVVLDASNDGIGYTAGNTNLSESNIAKLEQVFQELVAGNIKAPTSLDELESYLNVNNYVTPDGVTY